MADPDPNRPRRPGIIDPNGAGVRNPQGARGLDNGAHPLFIRPPPLFKSGTDLEVYLRRFQAYARAINCPMAERRDLLMSLLDDNSLSGVYRAAEADPEMTFDELLVQLRRAEGYTRNREKYITELRNRKRLRGESIWTYHLDLAR